MQRNHLVAAVFLLSVVLWAQNPGDGSTQTTTPFHGIKIVSFTFAPQTIAQAGITVENIRVANDSESAVVRVVNQSTKDITAFNFSVDVVFTNGRTDQFEHATDFLDEIMSTGTGTLHPGDNYEVRLDFAHKILSVSTKPDAVVYSDLTSETGGNSDALDRIVAERKKSALSAFKAAQIINEAAANNVTPDPCGMAIRQLRLLADQAKHSADMSEMQLRLIISDLENKAASESKADISSRRESLREYAIRKTKDAETQSAHSHLRRTQ